MINRVVPGGWEAGWASGKKREGGNHKTSAAAGVKAESNREKTRHMCWHKTVPEKGGAEKSQSSRVTTKGRGRKHSQEGESEVKCPT